MEYLELEQTSAKFWLEKSKYHANQKKFLTSEEYEDWETAIKEKKIRLEGYEIKIARDGKLESIASPSVNLDIDQKKIRQLYAGSISNLWNRTKNKDSFAKDLKNILNDAVNKKIILDDKQKKILKSK